MAQELLRFSTAGSVDDGKSTLIGRLLHDSGGVYEDQLEAATQASRQGLELAFLTDGLRAEREQGITIDVAYRYFATPKRKFIIADTPGHEQYTRNMATGASTSQVALVLLDARKGVLPQTVRHAFISWLLGMRYIVVVVNKMDLVDLSEHVFKTILKQFEPLAKQLDGVGFYFVPIVATEGDNVVRRSTRMPWFDGPSVLEFLESVPVEMNGHAHPLRMPVQYVIRGEGERAYAGQLVSGSIAVGDEVMTLPSGRKSRVSRIPALDRDLEEAFTPMSISIRLDDYLDVSRGDMIVDPKRPPSSARAFRAKIVWMSEVPLSVSRPYLIKHTSQTVCANMVEIQSRLDINSLSTEPTKELHLNDIGIVSVETHRPIFCDPYAKNRHTGSFVVIDPMSNLTVAAGMIESVMDAKSARPHISGHQGLTVWLTGLSSAGKTTLSRAIYEKLWARGYRVELVDGDEVRRYLSRDLGFSKEDRDENIRRIGFIAELLTRNGVIAIVSAISPYRAVRDEVRGKIANFLEVFVNAPLEVCEGRDVKGLYRRARIGELPSFTGIDDPYEPPLHPDVECRTDLETIVESADKVINSVEARLPISKAA
jgi:bifunctional enzyme CysN/CysC